MIATADSAIVRHSLAKSDRNKAATVTNPHKAQRAKAADDQRTCQKASPCMMSVAGTNNKSARRNSASPFPEIDIAKAPAKITQIQK